MPLVYDDEPGSWGRHSKGWPEFVIPASVIEAYAVKNPGVHYPCTGIVTPLMKKAKVPYGSYVSMGLGFKRIENQSRWTHYRTYHNVTVRVETADMKDRCVAALAERIVELAA